MTNRNYVLSATLELKDKLTGKLNDARKGLEGVKGSAAAASGALDGVGSMLMDTSMQMAGAAGIGFGIYDAIKSYADFEKEMSAVKAISGATGAEFDMLTEKARQMGADTKFSATESAQAFEYMAMAGWKTDDMVNGIEGVMNLAAASGEELGRVSDIVTDALTAFGLQASDSAHFADVLAAAATSSNTNVGMMGETFKYVASLAGALKYDVEDVATAIGVMANAGIKGSEAGTSLRSIFTRLVEPPEDAAKALDALGISIKNSDGTIKPFMQTMEEMRDKFSTLSDEQKVQYAVSIAGQEAMSGLLAIMNASEGDFKKVANAIDHADGAAEKMAKTRMDNLAGDIELVGGAWDQFIQTIMKGDVSGSLRSVVQEAGSTMDFLNERIKDGLDFGDVFALVGKLVTDLKNKFIEFDGVGSLLAGGALAAGLYKVIGPTKKVMSAVKGLAGKRKGGGPIDLPGPSSTKEMVVNAATVIVNGKSIAGGGASPGKNSGGVIFGPDGRPIQSGGRTQAPAPQPGRAAVLRANAKALGGVGALAAIFGAMDIYSTKSQNSALLEEAAWGVKQASDNIEELTKNGGSQEQWQSALDEYTKANDYRAQVEHDNRMREGDAIGGALGSTVGTVLGGAIGSFAGPAGTVIGMTAGGILGEIAGKRIGSWLSDYNVQNTVNFEKIAQWLNPKEKDPIGFDISGKTVPVDIVGDSIGIKDTTKDVSGPFGLQTDLSAIGPHAFDTPRDTSQDFGITEMQNMYTTGMFCGVQEEAQEAASASADAFSEASASISTDFENTGAQATATADNIQMDMLGSAQGSQDAWSSFPSWYDASVAVPTSDAAADCGADVSDSFETSASDTQGAWSGVGGFFSGLFASIKSGAASCAASVAQSMASAAASARASGHTNIAAGLDWIGSKAAWFGGVDYPHNAIGTSFAPGGWTEINEHGGEIVDLPTGSRVYPHATTLSMLKDTFENNLPTAIPVSAPSVSVDLPRTQSDAEATQAVITGNSFIVREEADIDKIAYKLLTLMQESRANMNPVEGVFA